MSHVGASGSIPRQAVVLSILVQSMACCGARAQEMVVQQEPIPDNVWSDMQGKSWHEDIGCPARAELVLLTVPYHDFQGESQLGQLIVAAKVAADVAAAFQEIYDSHSFRIERMELIDRYGGDDDQSMAANNTSAFNCRPVSAGLKPIAHMQGIAVDINPVQNPYFTGHPTSPMSVVKPEAGRPYIAEINRSADVIGLITPRSVVTEAFGKRQWRWATSGYITDYKHFSQNGK
ncbi:M15 family metallopeptidase [Microvirga yunnanensis]|uniref:M15 family metallopeptidase n=1 Tax=Microvirga yunnanensis TaxID=2953740 RepID=UPI0021C9C2F7|nr:M15 family metallopeptidase [Microvirga sp. HBU65207]